MSAIGDYSVKGSSTSKNSNVLSTITSGSGTGESGNIALQSNVLDSMEAMIRNLYDPNYTLPTIASVGGSPLVPATPGTPGLYSITFTPGLHLPDVAYININVIALTYQLNYTTSTATITSPATAIGTNIAPADSNATVTWVGNILTFTGYPQPLNHGIVSRQVSFDYTRILTDPVTLSTFLFQNTIPSPWNETESNGGVNLVMRDELGAVFLGTDASGETSASPTATYRNTRSANVATLSPHYFLHETNFGYTDNTVIGNLLPLPSLGFVQIYATGYVAPTPLIPAVSGSDALYLFYTPLTVTQTEIPTPDLITRFLLKDNSLTDGDTSVANAALLGDPEAVKLFTYIGKNAFQVSSSAAKIVTDSNVDAELCPSNNGGRFVKSVLNCVFTLNIIVQ